MDNFLKEISVQEKIGLFLIGLILDVCVIKFWSFSAWWQVLVSTVSDTSW